MKTEKTKKKIKPSDKFWKDSMMKVLETLYWEEATWAESSWQKYGISNSDRRKIESEFERWINKKKTI